MGPLPKRKLSKQSKRTRRNHDKLSLPHLVRCSNCGAYKTAYQVCKECGTYDGTPVVDKKDAE